jgi:hypothetical protein
MAVAFVAVLSGCHLAERSGTCAPIQDVTKAVIHDGRGEDRLLTDPQQIRRLMVFANARREVSQPRLYTMPAPRTTATFYRNADFVGSIGEGTNFFFVSSPHWKGTRKAATPEIDEFDQLIRVPQ